ncbi:ArcE [Desulforapulum autotrophicum HRM2]|uniref:ArcE n=1 Tax=Desulforapulum autotrophicum (strain ATCC 43914 / DSM 3382 / VKM B-1955 / HRM2) TaxID=177437 RepID=C0QC51_DESAH|nr:efflux RND transporter periplasmic adaptor subunit [Desulforapulum autotrophicum]ACN17068.1 ArcE [Desulforapulum autotrophicum HRM2]
MYRFPRISFVSGSILLLLVQLFAAGCDNPLKKTDAVAPALPPLVSAMTVGSLLEDPSHVYSGEVHGRFETGLAFRIPGKVIARHVDAGSVVKAGTVLMQVDPSDVQQAVNASRAQLAAARSQFTLASDQLGRFKALYERDFMSKAELDRYQNAHDSAQSLVKQARAQYTQASNQLAYCNLVAETPGVVLDVRAEQGQVVGAGQPVVIMARGDEKEVEIDIPENRIADFAGDTRFKVTFWALEKVEVQGRARVISPVADPITRTYKARITLVSPPAGVRLGMTASVLQDESVPSRLLIPLSAVYQTGEDPTVWVIQDDRVTQRQVVLGGMDGRDRIAVIKGLEPGDKIVTAGVHKLSGNEKVRVKEDVR